MLEALNFICFIAASATATILYVKSVSPAQLERQKIKDTYQRCASYRMWSMIAMVLALVFFILCRSLPLSNALAAPFQWPRWLSFVFSLLLTIPSLSLMITGLQDLGSESYTPEKKNKLKTRGIYRRIRHPQAYEALLWLSIALGLHSPLLLALSVPWLLLEIIMVMAEETDLIVRFGEPYLKYRDKTGMFFPKGKLDLSFLETVKEYIDGLFISSDDE